MRKTDVCTFARKKGRKHYLLKSSKISSGIFELPAILNKIFKYSQLTNIAPLPVILFKTKSQKN